MNQILNQPNIVFCATTIIYLLEGLRGTYTHSEPVEDFFFYEVLLQHLKGLMKNVGRETQVSTVYDLDTIDFLEVIFSFCDKPAFMLSVIASNRDSVIHF